MYLIVLRSNQMIDNYLKVPYRMKFQDADTKELIIFPIAYISKVWCLKV